MAADTPAATDPRTLEVRDLGHLGQESSLGRRWDELVAANPASGFMQSLAWAAFRRAQGAEVLHLGLFDGDILLGGCQWYWQPGPAPIFAAPEGPVLAWDDESGAGPWFRALIAGGRSRALAAGAIALRVEPRLVLRPAALRDFGRAPVDVVPAETLYLDLLPAEERILAAMTAKGRYNVRLAARRGVTVAEDRTAGAAHRFHRVVREAADRDGFFLEPAPYFWALAEALGPTGMARFFFAEYEGRDLGALLLLTFGRRATYLYGGVANDERQRMAGYALQWQAMREAKRLGCVSYGRQLDLGEIDGAHG